MRGTWMGKTPLALITGAGQGIGRGIALSLAENGFDIAGVDVLYEPENRNLGLFEVKAGVERLGKRFLPLEGDIAELGSHDDLLRRVLSEFGRLDVLINNAGVAPLKRMDILDTTPESYDRVMSINARGAFFLTQKAAKEMLRRKNRDEDAAASPCIVFITSISAEVSSPNRAEYCVSKAALSMTARLFADRLAGSAIPVFEIRPGIIRTDMTAAVKSKYDALIEEGLVPQRRWGFPEDIGRAVAALASGAFAFSTGSVFEISGGMNIRRL